MTPAPAPYRPCVGTAIFNREGLVWIGKRRVRPRPEDGSGLWQMPQGGIDPGEAPVVAAMREAREETGMTSLDLIGEAPDWYCYDFPPEAIAAGRTGRYRGQTQRWFAFRFTGDDSEIDISHGHGDAEAEFEAWRWESIDRVPDLIVAFKRPVYVKVQAAFAPLAVPVRNNTA